jgi:hypothetical protein
MLLPACKFDFSPIGWFPFKSKRVILPTLRRVYINACEPGSSVSIVSDHDLDDQAIEVRFPAEAKDFSSNLCVQTGSGAHPTSCRMGTGGSFPGGKARPGRDADHSPHLVPRSWMSSSYTMACSGTPLLLPPWKITRTSYGAFAPLCGDHWPKEHTVIS